MRFFIGFFLLAALLTGCATSGPHSEFVKTTDFSSLQTFTYRHSLVSGLEFRESEERLLKQLSETTLVDVLQERGFRQVSNEPDFYAVIKWRKAVSSYPDAFDSIDGPVESMRRRENPSYRFASRLHLVVELYENDTDEAFWRKELPNIFDATRLTEERIVDSVERAVANFPERIKKDPDLPDIQ